MKAGVRAVGVAESYRDTPGPPSPESSGGHRGESTLAATVVRADRTLDGLAYRTCTVGGTDATSAVIGLLEDLDRADVRYVLVSGISPAWYNVIDLFEIHARVDRPVLSVSFEASPGLEPALRDAFDGSSLRVRLDRYTRQPARQEVRVNDESVFVRAVGLRDTDASDVVRAFTPSGGRPEPLRVARLAARAGDRFRAPS